MLSTRRHAGLLASSDRPLSSGNRQGVTSEPAADASLGMVRQDVPGVDIQSHLSSLQEEEEGDGGAGWRELKRNWLEG